MPRRRRISLLACASAALIAVGCGSGDREGTIPPDEADELIAVVNEMEEDVADGSCDLLTQYASEFESKVQALPPAVDATVREELAEAATNLDRLAEDPPECPEEGGTGVTGDEPVDDPVVPAPPATTTTETDETEQTTTEEDTEDDGGDDGGTGNGGGDPQPPIEPPSGQEPPADPPGLGTPGGQGTGGTDSGGITGERRRAEP